MVCVALLGLLGSGATRPRYGGTLRVEVRETFETAETMPPVAGFVVSSFAAGKRALLTADENAAGGRPFLDSVEVLLGRALRDQSSDLDFGRADVVELGPVELRRAMAGGEVWSSSPVRVLALFFCLRLEDARVREALALSVDRSAIHTVLLQRQGELLTCRSSAAVAVGLGFSVSSGGRSGEGARAGGGTASGGAVDHSGAGRPGSPAHRRSDRVERGRDSVLFVSVASLAATADVRLVEVELTEHDPGRALAAVAVALGIGLAPRTDSPEALYRAERALLDGFRVIPLFDLPDVWGGAPAREGRRRHYATR